MTIRHMPFITPEIGQWGHNVKLHVIYYFIIIYFDFEP